MSGAVINSSSAESFFGDTLTKNISYSVVSGGSTLFVPVRLVIYTGDAFTVGVSDGVNTFATEIEATQSPGAQYYAGLFRLHNASGSKTIAVTVAGVDASLVYGVAQCHEATGLSNAAPDKTVSGTGSDDSPVTSATGVLAQADEFVIGVCTSAVGGIDDPSGWANLYRDGTTVTVPNSVDYLATTGGTSSFTVDWGTLDSADSWACVAATYLVPVAAGEGDLYYPRTRLIVVDNYYSRS